MNRETAKARWYFVCPKPKARTRFVPSLPEQELRWIIGKLAPAERKALAQIAETADLLPTEAGDFLLVPADPKLLDTLAAVGAEAEDRELDLHDEVETDASVSLGTEDDEDNADRESDAEDEPNPTYTLA